MTSDLATVPQLGNLPDLPERDRGVAEAVASGLRDVKAANIRRSYASAWSRFQEWAVADMQKANNPARTRWSPRPSGDGATGLRLLGNL